MIKLLAAAARMQQRSDFGPAKMLYEAALDKTCRYALHQPTLFETTGSLPPPLDRYTAAQWSLLVGDVESFIALAGGVDAAFRKACRNDELITAGELLKRGAGVDLSVGPRGRTLLLDAAYRGDLDGVELALEHGANLNRVDDDAYNGVQLCLLGGSDNAPEIWKALTSHGVLCSSDGNAGAHLFDCVLAGGSARSVAEFAKNTMPLTPTHHRTMAAWLQRKAEISPADARIVEVLLDCGLDPDTHVSFGTRAPLLGTAAWTGDVALTKKLLASGAEVERLPQAGSDTPLLRAAYRGHRAVYDLLVAAGADPQRKGSNRSSASYLMESS